MEMLRFRKKCYPGYSATHTLSPSPPIPGKMNHGEKLLSSHIGFLGDTCSKEYQGESPNYLPSKRENVMDLVFASLASSSDTPWRG